MTDQPPSIEVRRGDEEDDGGEETERGVDQSPGPDSHLRSRVDYGRVQEPGDAQANQDVEHVRTDRVRHRHVAVT